MSAPQGMGVLQPLSFACGVGVSFIGTPILYSLSWPALQAQVLWHYSPDFREAAPWVWWIILALGIYALVRLALHLIFALFTLILTLSLFAGRRRR